VIRILNIDDHTIVHRGLRQIVAEEPDLVVGGEARTSHDGLALRLFCGLPDRDILGRSPHTRMC
jgi:DNA-binding NarL/FixJ family response regulator